MDAATVSHDRPPDPRGFLLTTDQPQTTKGSPQGLSSSSKGLAGDVVVDVGYRSYKSALAGGIPLSGNTQNKWICVGENDIISSIKDGIRSLKISDSIKEKLYRPWSNTVVVHLLGKSIGYAYLCHRLRSMWKPLGGGPWLILEHYLIVQKWDPNFRVSDKLPSKMVVWIRLPHLPIVFFHPRILSALGNLIGSTVKIDAPTLNANRGKFARIAVEINMDEPLAQVIELDGAWKKVEYENISALCFECGKVGHEAGSFPLPGNLTPEALVVSSSQSPPVQLGEEALLVGKEASGAFSPWMVVCRRHRRQRSDQKPDMVTATVGKDADRQSRLRKGKTVGGKNGGNLNSEADSRDFGGNLPSSIPPKIAPQLKAPQTNPSPKDWIKNQLLRIRTPKMGCNDQEVWLLGLNVSAEASNAPKSLMIELPIANPFEGFIPTSSPSALDTNSMPIRANVRFSEEESAVRVELEKTLWQEEILWLQKSRLRWNLQGDRNMMFFHLSTLRRRKVNHIKGLKNPNGVWIFDNEDLMRVAIEHFKSLFAAVLNGRVQNSTYEYIIERIDKKLDGWKRNSLSLAGRVTLAVHKAHEGLGLRHAKELNEAFMMKLGWQILKNPNKLWVRVITSKHIKEVNGCISIRRLNWGSQLWRGIRGVWPTLRKVCQKSIRNGRETSFWFDSWLDNGVVLADVASQDLDELESEKTVVEASTADGIWVGTILIG
ncbi:Putative ribonuclease H protein At1g65750 [Linum perenne]